MEATAKRLRSTRLLGPLSIDQLTHLLEAGGVQTAMAGDIIIKESDMMHDHLILIEGELEAQRTWSVASGHDKSYSWNLKPMSIKGGFVFLGAANRIRARALTNISYVTINADKVDELLGWSQQFAEDIKHNPELKRRMNLVKQVSIFHEVPLENVKTVFERMYEIEVQADDAIVTEGEEGDRYYLIDSGEAKVIRTDPFTGQSSCAAKLGPGDAFGEEALLQNAYRNATITMTTPGKLLVLDKKDFDELLKPGLVQEVTAEQAQQRLKNGEAKLLDCRYDMEYEESRIPGAQLIQLDRLRWDVHMLDPEEEYIVYCRSGRRSKASVFLLRERNIKAASIIGGIKNWPYEIDASPLEVTLV